MKQILYGVGIEDKQTHERFCLKIWAGNEHEATAGIKDLICYEGCYRWTGTGPMHDDNGDVITRNYNKKNI